MLKRWLAAVAVATALLVALATPALAFIDVPADHPYATAISDLASRGIINGYDAEHFGPDDPITRQQFAKVVSLTLGLVPTQGVVCPFPDVSPIPGSDDPLYPQGYVTAAAEQQITQGYDDGTYRPYNNITRAQVVTMVVRATSRLRSGVLGAPPAAYVPSWWQDVDGEHLANARVAEINGLLNGVFPNRVASDPWAPMPREEVAQVLYNLLRRHDPPMPPAAGETVYLRDLLSADTILCNPMVWTMTLIGVTPPERGQPLAEDAAQAVLGLMWQQPVTVEYDTEQADIYGRIPVYLWAGTKMVNEEVIRLGFARANAGGLNTKYAARLAAAETEAREARRGIWGDKPSVEDFFSQGVTYEQIAAINREISLVFDYDPTARLSAAGELSPLRRRTYQVLQFMKSLRFDDPLPWTNRTMYEWFRSSVRASISRTHRCPISRMVLFTFVLRVTCI